MGYKINIAELNKRIAIGTIKSVTNKNGFPEKQFIEEHKIWCSGNDLYGKEFYEACAVQREDTVKFKIRYNKYISCKNAIKFRDNIYTIEHIDNLDYDNRFMIIKAKILDKDKVKNE
jgi:SPP1 family predicted phage head-tail adaptor